MEEKTCKSARKTLSFEKSGEILSVTISLENISPNTSKESIVSLVDTLFKEVKAMIT